MAAATSIPEIKDFRDVIHLLEEHPEWQADLRRVILTNDLLALPQQVDRLIEAQTHTDKQIQALTEAQQRTDAQLAALTIKVDALTEAQQRTDVQLVALTEAQKRTHLQLEDLIGVVRSLTQIVQGLVNDVAKLKGYGLEMHYRQHGAPFFGTAIHRPHVLSDDEATELIEAAIEQGTLSETEAEEIQRADLIVRGRRKPDGVTVYLVIEVSWTVDADDVERAARRADLLAKTGLTVFPGVAGETVGSGAARLAQALQAWQITDAKTIPPTA